MALASTILALLLVLWPCLATAETQVFFTNKPDSVLAWEHSDPDLAGFKMYHKITGSTGDPIAINIPGAAVRTYTWTAVPNGSHDIYLTAYDLYGNESDPSDTIQLRKKIAKPGRVMKVTVTNPSFSMVIP
jgi:hypothetical protein